MTGLVLTFVARPLSVVVSSVVQRMGVRDLAFISWAGLRGAVPIVLATIPLAEGVDGADDLFDIVFVMVVVYTLLTGPTLPAVARWLRVARRSEPRGLDVEAAPLERVAADLLQVTIAPTSKMHGVEVGELRLPAGASVSLVIRSDEVLVPNGARSCARATTWSSSPPASSARPPRRGCARSRSTADSPGGPGAAPVRGRLSEVSRGRRPVTRRRRPAVGGGSLRDDRLDLLGAQRLELLADHDDHAVAERVARHDLRLLELLADQLDGRVGASSAQIWVVAAGFGESPTPPATKPRSTSSALVDPARPLRPLPL